TRYEQEPALKAQVPLLLAIAKQDPSVAEKIIDDGIGSNSIRKLASKFIEDFYESVGDHAAKKNYQQRVKHLSGSPIDTMLTIRGEFPSVLLTLLDFCILHNWVR
ncbi:MAG: hypothetical protein ACXVOI_09840, partial [Tumebacillaceae bacterium]